MRRTDREITSFPELIRIIQQCDVCRLALYDTPYPYILPLNFGMATEGETVTLYFHGATMGKKYDLIAQNPNASFEMDCHHQLIVDKDACKCTMAYESVIGQGALSLVSGEEKWFGLRTLMRQYHSAEDFTFPQNIVEKTTVFKLTVISMTGKRRSVT